MFLRSNAFRTGLDYAPKKYHAHYFGAFIGGALQGVLSLNQNGDVFSQSRIPETVKVLVAAAKAAEPSFAVHGVLAPEWQANLVLALLPPADLQTRRSDDVFRLAIAGVPQAGPGRIAAVADQPLLTNWKLAFETEYTQAVHPPHYRAEAEAEVARHVQHGDIFLALDNTGAPVAKAAFNARLPDIVQIGGVCAASAAQPPPCPRRGGSRLASCAGGQRWQGRTVHQ